MTEKKAEDYWMPELGLSFAGYLRPLPDAELNDLDVRYSLTCGDGCEPGDLAELLACCGEDRLVERIKLLRKVWVDDHTGVRGEEEIYQELHPEEVRDLTDFLRRQVKLRGHREPHPLPFDRVWGHFLLLWVVRLASALGKDVRDGIPEAPYDEWEEAGVGPHEAARRALALLKV